jgi:hypothetical protein
VAADLELGRDPVLGGGETELVQARDLTVQGRFVGQVRERGSPPQREGVGEPRGRRRRV